MDRLAHNLLDRVRRYIVVTLAFTASLGALVLALDLMSLRYGPTATAALAPAGLIGLVQYVRISGFSMPTLRAAVPRRGEIAATVVLTLGAWWLAQWQAPLGIGWALPCSLVIGAWLPMVGGWWRWPAVVGGGLLVGLSGYAVEVLSGRPSEGSSVAWVVVLALLVPFVAFCNFLQVWLWSMVRQLDSARQVAGELAVAEERLRFAAELHDIQGHHLQAIALKGELAARLIGQDDEAARVQVTEVGELARTALKETRAVVHGYRRSSLPTEIGNAVDILRAAGINATVRGSATEVPPPLQPLFGILVREGTTNILRHSTAVECSLTVEVISGRVRVELSNDGVRDRDTVPGSGLQGLKERFAVVGGSVRAQRDGDGFHLIGEAVLP
ncbi:two-component system sensor histidine kinase DesK [Actinokineospora baliensis]|uniref:sensor histidine kinase n=1 Tax=Actinokineospora baliensis TaxID=547056 RepID=UPI0027DD515A|nr:histidine kinase [Actinokineospora baliensis]MBM7775222.1 two-component system sensor histidine kinase DesK [Actinokineospora baliensis]